jgi:hypothetical protein
MSPSSFFYSAQETFYYYYDHERQRHEWETAFPGSEEMQKKKFLFILSSQYSNGKDLKRLDENKKRKQKF